MIQGTVIAEQSLEWQQAYLRWNAVYAQMRKLKHKHSPHNAPYCQWVRLMWQLKAAAHAMGWRA